MRQGGRASAEAEVVLELDGLPTTWRPSTWRWMPWVWGVYGGLAVVQLLLVAGDGDVEVRRVVLYAVQVVLGTSLAVHWAGVAVRLEPGGYRVGGLVGRGRLRPWSCVDEIRAPSRWLRHAEVRGTRAADAPVALVGMTGDQAAELRARLGDARARAQGPPP